MNGVEQAIAEEMLAVQKEQAALLKQMMGQYRSAGGGAGNTARMNDTAIQFNSSLGRASYLIGAAMVPAVGLVAAGFNGLVKVTQGLYLAQKALAETAVRGTGSLSSFYDAMSNLPYGLGFLASVLGYHSKVVQANLETFQKLSQTGATLGGNLDEVKQSAKGMGLSLDEFASVMETNVNIIRFLGGSADEGARNLIKFNTRLMQGDVGRQLLGMGFTIENVNTMLASYASIVGGIRETDLKNQKRMEQSVKTFATELDLAAQLEGKTRKQKEEELKKAAQQAAIDAKLATMSADSRDKYTQAFAAAQRQGQGAVDYLHSQMLGFPPMTEAAQLYAAVQSKAAEAQSRNAALIMDSSSALSAKSKIDKNAAEGDIARMKAYESYGKSAEALTFETGALGDMFREMGFSTADLRNQNIKTEEQRLKQFEQMRAQQDAAKDEAADAALRLARAKYQSDELMNMLYTVLKPLEPILFKLQDLFIKLAGYLTDFIVKLRDTPGMMDNLKLGAIGAGTAFLALKTYQSIRAARNFLRPPGTRGNPYAVEIVRGGGLMGGLPGVGGGGLPRTPDILLPPNMRNSPINPGAAAATETMGRSGGGLQAGVSALMLAGRNIHWVALGGAAIGAAIAAIGAGIAGATWIMSKSLPSLAEGLRSFEKINGPNLQAVGIGMAGLGAGILAMGVGGIVSAISNIGMLFGGDSVLMRTAKELLVFQALEIDKDRVSNNAAAFREFATAMSLGNLGMGISGIVSGISGIVQGVGAFFSGGLPMDKFVKFSELKINPERTAENAKAFRLFSEAMSQYKGIGSGLGAVSSAIADAAVRFFKADPPFKKFEDFAKLDIDPDKTRKNAIAFMWFANAFAEYRGGPGLIDTISSIAGAAFGKMFGVDGPIESFRKFAKDDFGSNAGTNAAALFNYAKGLQALSQVKPASMSEVDYKKIVTQMNSIGDVSPQFKEFTTSLKSLAGTDTGKLDGIADSLSRIKTAAAGISIGKINEVVNAPPASVIPSSFNVSETSAIPQQVVNNNEQIIIQTLSTIAENTKRTADLVGSTTNYFA